MTYCKGRAYMDAWRAGYDGRPQPEYQTSAQIQDGAQGYADGQDDRRRDGLSVPIVTRTP
jgi:hypothetical protein